MKLKSLLILLILPLFGCSQNAKKNISQISSDSKSVKVIELFTSEGCSSCPPADKLVEEVQKNNSENVIILAYHVDYWDRLGWKDTFSQKKFSERQSWYSSIFNLNSIYTPQIVVDGQKQFVGSDESELSKALKNPTLNIQNRGLSIKISDSKNDKISVEYNLEKINPDDILNFALVQNHAITQVKRGENSNRTLSHVDIVKEFTSVNPGKTGKIDLNDDNLNQKDFHVVAFLQNKKTGKISAAETSSF
ncbi:DUF1223 domain-containing protein [Halpernia frigidisoli]|uniref:DUF1223 domain-containing protein n=1 Tax=Halpernia frigidisoli TaxID=1125876 RepID=A0A1I3FVR2_9FLAO|nr:DUF1223 domain-containing protein [Halpernia frigidisoli]SFI15265.1 hypothetical protein SAMN05443292_1661 [Halpernia frigidisoli]